MYNNIPKTVELGTQYAGIIPITVASTDHFGKPKTFLCKCARCNKVAGELDIYDITHYRMRCCRDCDSNDLTGMRFGKLVAMEKTFLINNTNTKYEAWLCKCDCGNTKVIRKDSLTLGMTRSCGCIKNYDIVGKRFGHLTVTREIGVSSDHAKRYFYCKCDCGSIVVVCKSNLVSGHTRSCGRCARVKNIEGQRFGRLVAVRLDPYRKVYTSRVWECKCDCGKTIYVPTNKLVNGHTKSCGCLREFSKFSPEEEKLNSVFSSMKQRCYNKSSVAYKDYGGRGIYICDEWLRDRKAFIVWSLENGYRLNSGLSIDRIDVNGPYAPWNCRWVDWYTQANNKRTSVKLEIDGITLTISEWADYLKLPRWKLFSLHKKNGDDFVRMIVRKHRQKCDDWDSIASHPMPKRLEEDH